MGREMPVKDMVKAKLEEEKSEKVLDEIVANNPVQVAGRFQSSGSFGRRTSKDDAATNAASKSARSATDASQQPPRQNCTKASPKRTSTKK